jgi:hypothetical protein
MISRWNLVKLAAIIAIVALGALYWYYAEHRTGPVEEVEKSIVGEAAF